MKDNNKQPPEEPQEQPPTQLVMGVIVPEPVFDCMKDWIKEYVPTGKTEMMWQTIKQLRAQQLQMQTNPPP